MHPHAKEEKTHRRAKHHKLGVHGEHDDEKAERLCRADGGPIPIGPTPSMSPKNVNAREAQQTRDTLERRGIVTPVKD